MSLLTIEELSLCRHGDKVLDNISLTIGRGEFVGLIGPNGAGKSTLLKAMSQLIEYDGNVVVDGCNSCAMTAQERARLISYLPQERDIHWPLEVERLIGLGRPKAHEFFSTPSEGDCRAIELAMARMDILELRKRRATELSGGERARVLIARVLAQETPLILADEPTSGLDPAHQIALMSCFAELAKEGVGIVSCLHELPLAARWCSRIIVIDDGRIVADGTPINVLTADMLRSVYQIEVFRAPFQEELVVLPWSLSSESINGGEYDN